MSANSINIDHKPTLSTNDINNQQYPEQIQNQQEHQPQYNENNINPEAEDESLPLLFKAIKNNDLISIIDLLLLPNFYSTTTFIDINGHGLIRYILDSSLTELLEIFIAKDIINIQSISIECEHLSPIGYAIKYGKIDMVRTLLDLGETIIGTGPYTQPLYHPYWVEELPLEHGRSLYQIALQITNNDIIKYQIIDELYNYGYDINDPKYSEYPVLFTACHNGNLNDFKYLLNLNADPYAISEVDGTILVAAVYSGSIELVDYIIGLKGDNNSNNNELDEEDKDDEDIDDEDNDDEDHEDEDNDDEDNEHDKDEDDVNDGANNPLSVHYQTEKGRNAIAAAIEYGHIGLVQHLMDKHRANVGFINHLGHTGLHLASFLPNPRTREMLEFIYPLIVPKYCTIESGDFGGDTALSTSIEIGNKISFDFLIEKNAKQDIVRTNGGNLFHLAAEFSLYNQIGIDLVLNIPNLDINAKNDDGHTPIQLAIANCNVRAVQSFLQHPDIDIHIYTSTPLEVQAPAGIYDAPLGSNLLHLAIITNNVEIVQLLLDAGIDINELGGNKRTLFDAIIVYGAIDLVKFFTNHSNPKYCLDIHNSISIDTPYHTAYTVEEFGILDWLIENKIDGINLPAKARSCPYTLFQRSILDHHHDLTRKLLTAKADPRATTLDGSNILHLLIAHEQDDAIEDMSYILSEWPDLLHQRDKHNCTPLSFAILNGNIEYMDFFRDNGSNLYELASYGFDYYDDGHPSDKKGVTILHLAALMTDDHIENGPATVEWILNNTTYTMEEISLQCYTPLLYAAVRGKFQMLKCFWSFGANRDVQTRAGLTVLDCAIFSNDIAMVKWLLSQKKFNQETNQEESYYNINIIYPPSKFTSFHKAIMYDRLDIAKCLLHEYNADPFVIKDVDILHLARSEEMEDWCSELISKHDQS